MPIKFHPTPEKCGSCDQPFGTEPGTFMFDMPLQNNRNLPWGCFCGRCVAGWIEPEAFVPGPGKGQVYVRISSGEFELCAGWPYDEKGDPVAPHAASSAQESQGASPPLVRYIVVARLGGATPRVLDLYARSIDEVERQVREAIQRQAIRYDPTMWTYTICTVERDGDFINREKATN